LMSHVTSWNVVCIAYLEPFCRHRSECCYRQIYYMQVVCLSNWGTAQIVMHGNPTTGAQQLVHLLMDAL